MAQRYEPKYTWKRTQIDERDPPTDYDWQGFDGVSYIGRIRKEFGGPTNGKWHWAGSYPRTHMGRPPAWNAGHCDTAREATQKVEEYWERCLELMTPR
jgi:hypothetical protein